MINTAHARRTNPTWQVAQVALPNSALWRETLASPSFYWEMLVLGPCRTFWSILSTKVAH